MKYFDTHTHACYSLLPPNEVTCLQVSTQFSDFPCTQSHSSHFNCIYAIGFHPWFVIDLKEKDLFALEERLLGGDFQVLGEIGLDYAVDYRVTKPKQLEVFEGQLALAVKYNLSVSIHGRKSWEDILLLLKKYPVNFLLHGFSGSLEQAKQFMDLGGGLGVNGVICNPNAVRYHRLVRALPLDGFVLETDCPFVSDLNKHPILVDQVADTFAELTGHSVTKVAQVTYSNALKFYNYSAYPLKSAISALEKDYLQV